MSLRTPRPDGSFGPAPEPPPEPPPAGPREVLAAVWDRVRWEIWRRAFADLAREERVRDIARALHTPEVP